MKTFFSIIFLLVSVFSLGTFFPWWILILPCFVGGYYIGKSSFKSFLIGFASTLIIWTGLLWLYDSTSSSDISSRISNILFIKSKYILFLFSGIIGGLVGGTSSLLGFLIRNNNKIISNDK